MTNPVGQPRGGSPSRPAKCPNAENHTEEPEDYLAWHEWARRRSKTHRQIKCWGCGLYAIWIPRKAASRV